MLPEDEARHAARTLRKQPGDEIVVVDGDGGWHRVRLHHVDKQQVVGAIVETRREIGEPSYHLTIGIGLLKNRNRFETFVEKAVELGVSAIWPLQTARTEKESIRETRTHNILVAAMKQCGRTRLPALAEPQSFDAALEAAQAGAILIAHEQVESGQDLASVLRRLDGSHAAEQPMRVAVFIGPEGGFTDDEVRAVQAAGGQPVSLGPRRLRTETAALTAAAAAMLAFA